MDIGNQVDEVLLANMSDRWMKSAMVIAKAMSQLKIVAPLADDVFLGQRLVSLAAIGLIESQGDISQLRYSEVRLAKKRGMRASGAL